MKNNNFEKIIGLAIGLSPVIGIIILIYLLYDIGFTKIINTFRLVPLEFYLVSFSLFFLRFIIFSYKWHYISKKQKLNVGMLYLGKIFVMSLFYASVTPASIGWHIRIYYIKKKTKATWEKCIANSFLDSSLTSLSGLFLASIGAFLLVEYLSLGYSLTVFSFFILNLVIFTVFVGKKTGSKFFNFFIVKLMFNNYKKKLNRSIELLYEDIPHNKDFLIPFLLEITLWFIGAFQVYIIAYPFSINMPIILFLFTAILSTSFAAALPITIGGLGVREGIFVLILTSFGVTPEIAIVVSLGGFITKNIIPGFIGLIISLIENLYNRKMVDTSE